MTDDLARLDSARMLGSVLGNLTRRLRQTRTGAIRFAESSALVAVFEHGPATSAELARAEGISPQAMGTTLGALERRGFIARSSDPADGRRVLLTVTDAGREYGDFRTRTRAAQLARILAEEFTDAEVAQIMDAAPLLDRLAERIITDARDNQEVTHER